ncbi:hypothetical protein PN36_24380 [Candidatus Thiomargarita nelsonii]|uniref:Uncharacterized protein n=1 Tax=Candidatus Thiomargarita nelsonii TaxID=1003181 RepID=A0A4E0QMU2_9GAMM|nr:hypothetical protein PN36_24380 [Candidatus Thiomargarita nelsonii]
MNHTIENSIGKKRLENALRRKRDKEYFFLLQKALTSLYNLPIDVLQHSKTTRNDLQTLLLSATNIEQLRDYIRLLENRLVFNKESYKAFQNKRHALEKKIKRLRPETVDFYGINLPYLRNHFLEINTQDALEKFSSMYKDIFEANQTIINIILSLNTAIENISELSKPFAAFRHLTLKELLKMDLRNVFAKLSSQNFQILSQYIGKQFGIVLCLERLNERYGAMSLDGSGELDMWRQVHTGTSNYGCLEDCMLHEEHFFRISIESKYPPFIHE